MTIETTSTRDPFDVDGIRHRLATTNSIAALRASYDEGNFPSLPEMSSTELWEAMSDFKDVPEFRIRRLRQVANLLPETCQVLDIGSGWGEVIPMVMEKTGREYTGLDFSKAMLAEVAQKYPQCKFVHGDTTYISGQYDVVMALEVCEHILAHKIFPFYLEIQRLLKPNGRFIITVPVFENLRASTLMCPQCGQLHNRMGHVRSYTPSLIKAELELAGFDIIHSSFVYAFFDNTIWGKTKRIVADYGRRALGLGGIQPLNIVLVGKMPGINSPSVGQR